MDGLIQIKSAAKGPSVLKVGTSHSNNFNPSGCRSYVVTFSDVGSVNVAAITFTNRYCGILTVAARYKLETENSGESFKFVWKCLIDSKKLMPHFHYSTGAEGNFIFRSSEFLHEAKDVSSLKFVLQQPSVQFTEFSIENIKVFSEDLQDSRTVALPAWLTTGHSSEKQDKSDDHGLPVDAISQSLQKMWALAQKTHDMSKNDKVKPARFDKDGLYEINLLSYQ